MANRVFKVGSREYIEKSQIGQGGNGIVWKVTCEGIEYALKQLNTEDSKKKERFINEINFCKNSQSENIVKIIESGENHGKIFYVMPLYESDLAKIIQKTINLEDAFNYSIQIVKGIKYLHENKVIHRDLKPENILINPGVVIADLGIAHFENSILTAKNELVANRWYAAPEQKNKGNSRNLSSATDIYSLGLIINEIFTGEKLEGSDYTKVSDRYPWLIKIDELIDKCIKFIPNERPKIDVVLQELKLIKGEAEREFREVQNNIIGKNYRTLSHKVSNQQGILNRATEDVLIATYLYKNKTKEELKAYNLNYNANIHYTMKNKLKTIYFKHLVLAICEDMFQYESQSKSTYTPINLEIDDNKKIFDKFADFLHKNKIWDSEILKYFTACCDDHCREILNKIENIHTEVEDLEDTPIIYLVQKLKKYNIDFKELKTGVEVIWDKSQYPCQPDYVENYTPLKYQEDKRDKDKIIQKFVEKYNATDSIDKDKVVIRFNKQEDYQRFKAYALTLVEPNSFFESAVKSLTRINREFEGIVELKSWDDYDIGITLAKVLGEIEIE